MQARINELIKKIHKASPLILNITNHVTMDFVANGLLSIGASPIMCESLDELEDLIKIANAVVINIGTLNNDFINLCEKACMLAAIYNKPVTFDPVGAGASYYRTDTSIDFLNKFNFKILRGNASEVSSLNGNNSGTKGVDSNIQTSSAIEDAKILTERFDMLVAISGKLDAVVKNNEVEIIDRGSAFMPLVTGSGCLLSAILSAFDVVHDNTFEAVVAGILFYNITGEKAALNAKGPGSFKMHFLDELSSFAVSKI